MKFTRKTLAIAAVASVTGSTTSSAATITQAVTQTASQDWNLASSWGGTAPTSGNDYVVGAGFRLNSPALTAPASTSFAGDSLRLDGDGSNNTANIANFQLRAESFETVTISSLIMNGGRLALNQNSTFADPGILVGSITAQADSVWTTSVTDRHLRVDSLISGSASFTLLGNIGGSFQINNASNTYSGVWNITSTTAYFTSAGATGVGSSFTVGSGGSLTIADDWTGTLNVAAAGAGTVTALAGDTYTLNLSIDNAAFTTTGTYTAAELNAATGTSVFGGDGTFVVIPEPSSAVLGLFGALGLLRRRR